MSDPRQRDSLQDKAVADTFPASDPTAGTADTGNRAVPPQAMMGRGQRDVPGAVVLQRRFRDGEAAKLALEGLVRDGPIDRDCAELHPAGQEVELRISAPANDAERIRKLLASA